MDVLEILAIVMVFGTGMVGLVAFSPIGKAIGERLKGTATLPAEELDDVREQLAEVRHQVSELAERQDFTERVVAQAREKGALQSGPDA